MPKKSRERWKAQMALQGTRNVPHMFEKQFWRCHWDSCKSDDNPNANPTLKKQWRHVVHLGVPRQPVLESGLSK